MWSRVVWSRWFPLTNGSLKTQMVLQKFYPCFLYTAVCCVFVSFPANKTEFLELRFYCVVQSVFRWASERIGWVGLKEDSGGRPSSHLVLHVALTWQELGFIVHQEYYSETTIPGKLGYLLWRLSTESVDKLFTVVMFLSIIDVKCWWEEVSFNNTESRFQLHVSLYVLCMCN